MTGTRLRCALPTILLAALLAGALCVRYAPARYAAQLEPNPDATEYALGALAMMQGRMNSIVINNVVYPSHWSFGFPAMLVPVVSALDTRPERAVYGVLLFGLGSLCLTYGIGRRLFGTQAALGAVAVMAASLRHIESSRAVMSEHASTVMLLIMLQAALEASAVRWCGNSLLLAGLASSLAVAIHLANALPVVVVWALVAWWQKGSRLRAFVFLAAGALPVLALQLAYNIWVFGHPLRTGYHYWMESVYGDLTVAYNLRYLLGPAPPDNSSTLSYYTPFLLGLNNRYYPAVFVPVAIGGLIVAWRRAGKRLRRSLILLIGYALTCVLPWYVYFFKDDRHFLLALPVVALLGAYCLVVLWHLGRRLWTRRVFVATAAIVFAFLIVLAAFVPIGVAAVRNSYLWAVLRRGREPPLHWKYLTARYINGHVETNAWIISGISGAYLQHYVIDGTERLYVAIGRYRVEYLNKRSLPNVIVASESVDTIRDAIGRGIPVYLMTDHLTAVLNGEEYRTLEAAFAFHQVGGFAAPSGGYFALVRLANK